MRKAKEGLCLRWRMPFPSGNCQPVAAATSYEKDKVPMNSVAFPGSTRPMSADPEHVGDPFAQGSLPTQLRK